MRRASFAFVVVALLTALVGVASAQEEEVAHSDNVVSLARPQASHYVHKIVFSRTHAFVGAAESARSGSVDVFKMLDRPPYLKKVGKYPCTGANFEGAVTRWRHFVFQPVEAPVNRVGEPPTDFTKCFPDRGGIRVLDVSNPARPQVAGFIELDCGSHNVTPYERGGQLFIYNFNACSGQEPASTGIGGVGTAFTIEVIKFDPKDPSGSRLAGRPTLYPMAGCHDLTIFEAKSLAACVGVGQSALVDVSDPEYPETLGTFPTGHYNADMGQFTWDGKYLVIDEVDNRGQDGTNFCHVDGDPRGNYYIYDISDPKDVKQVGTYVTPHTPPMWEPSEGAYRCHASHFNVLPMKDPKRYVMATSWANGGLSVVDFSDPTAPKELAYWQPLWGNLSWFSYWFNGRIYVGENRTDSDGVIMCGLVSPVEPCPEGGLPGQVRVLEVDGLGREDVKFFRNGYVPQIQPAYLATD